VKPKSVSPESPKLKIEGITPRPKRLSLHPLAPQEALRSALKSGKVKKKSSK